eukprot:8574503-Lingulodinium_polyedra.AAC.1
MAANSFLLASPMDPHTESAETTWQQMNGDQWGRMRANGGEEWKAVESSGEQWRAVESSGE